MSSPDLKHSRRAKATPYDKGNMRLKLILDAAKEVFIDQGYNRITLRNIAQKAGITVGNLNYYYKTKEDLLRDLLDMILKSYLDDFERVIAVGGETPIERFESLVRYLIDDLNTTETTKFFPELWALSNHDEYATQLMKRMYDVEREVLAGLIKEANTKLTSDQVDQIALFVSSSIEGMTMFVGSNKSHEGSLESMKKIACRCFVTLLFDGSALTPANQKKN